METKPEEKLEAPAADQKGTVDGASEEITAEFNTEDVKKEVKAMESKKSDLKSWIPVFVGLITIAMMTAYAFRFWLPK